MEYVTWVFLKPTLMNWIVKIGIQFAVAQKTVERFNFSMERGIRRRLARDEANLLLPVMPRLKLYVA